ncbi:hypothetical protein LEMLEM_LOCUS4438 [Lemmus lemmus]
MKGTHSAGEEGKEHSRKRKCQTEAPPKTWPDIILLL